ncbi:MAG: proline racemase [Candidatus Methylomirabilota bacterium]|nr:MAG: proline racemase [candidate division NC10 bacterium]
MLKPPNRQPPTGWRRIETLDAHTCGEPLRIVLSGLPAIPGKTILEKRRYVKEHLDHLRTGLMFEPRGHADMYGAILTEPVSNDGDCGVIFMHNEGYSTMCGHGIIALTCALLDTGMVDKTGDAPELRIDSPAGRVTATGHRRGGRVTKASFHNVPSFVFARDCQVDVPEVGRIPVDIAFGGAFYAFCPAASVGATIVPEEHDRLIHFGKLVKRAVMAQIAIRHPFEEDLGFLYGTIFTGPPADPRHHSRNVCIFAEGEVDRSPTGTGVSARAALHHSKGELAPGNSVVIESILSTTMTVRVAEVVEFGGYPAVIPEVSGMAYITGRNEFHFDPDDPLINGFIFR